MESEETTATSGGCGAYMTRNKPAHTTPSDAIEPRPRRARPVLLIASLVALTSWIVWLLLVALRVM